MHEDKEILTFKHTFFLDISAMHSISHSIDPKHLSNGISLTFPFPYERIIATTYLL